MEMFWNYVRIRHCTKCFFGYVTAFSLTLVSIHPTYSFGVEFDEFMFGIKGWNNISDIENLMRPIRSLKENASTNNIAKEVAAFKSKIDKIYNTGLSIEQAFDLVLAKLSENGIYLKKSELDSFIVLVNKYYRNNNIAMSNNGSFTAKKQKKQDCHIYRNEFKNWKFDKEAPCI